MYRLLVSADLGCAAEHTQDLGKMGMTVRFDDPAIAQTSGANIFYMRKFRFVAYICFAI